MAEEVLSMYQCAGAVSSRAFQREKKEYLVTHIPKKKTVDVSQSTDRSKAGEEALDFPSGDSLSCLSPPGTECDSTCSQSQHLGG